MHKRDPYVWSIVGLVAIISGEALERAGFYELAPLPLVAAAGALVIAYPTRRIISSLCGALIILLLAESSLSSGSMVTTGPVWAAAVLLLGLILNWRQVGLPRRTVIVVLLCIAFILPTAIAGDLNLAAKSVGIAGLWFLAFVSAANLPDADKPILWRVIVGAGVVESLLAIAESLVESDFVRTHITGNASDGYIVRPNVILGDWTNRAQGTVGYAIPFGAFIVVAILVVVFSGVIANKTAKFSIIALLLVAMLLSGARSSFAALAVGLGVGFVVLVLRARKSDRRVPGFRWMLIAMVALVLIGLTFFVQALRTGDFSLIHRGGVLESATNMFDLPLTQLLLGSGYDSARPLFESGVLETTGLPIVDNTLLTALIFSGIVGLLLFMAMVAWAFLKSSPFGKAVLSAMIALFFFYDLFSWHLSAFLLFAFVGFASELVAIGKNTRLSQRDGVPVRPRHLAPTDQV